MPFAVHISRGLLRCAGRRRGRPWSRLLWLAVLAVGWSTMVAAATGTPATQGSAVPSSSSLSGSMADIFQEPQKYLDREVTVEGTLVAAGRGIAVTFYLRADSGARLQVDPWAPLDVYPPRAGGAAVKSMPTYVGRRLRLTGRLTNRGGSIILQVSAAQELA